MIYFLIIAPMLNHLSHKGSEDMIAFSDATFIFIPKETENTVKKISVPGMTFIKGYDK